jgi:hypothetical protein
MAKPVKKPLKDALEAIMEEYGALDWAVAVRGDNQAIIAGSKEAVLSAFWQCGSGEKREYLQDQQRLGMLLMDMERLRFSMLSVLNS